MEQIELPPGKEKERREKERKGRQTLILGGVRSGKSRLAERLARGSGLEVIYIATARASGIGEGNDEELRRRIAGHRARRPPEWELVEEPLALADTLIAHAAPGRCLIVDCLTLWLTNLLLDDDDARLARERGAFLESLPGLPGELLLVSNETNMGIIPLGALSRRFCDEAGELHQELAQWCSRVVWMVAGLPQVLKGDVLPQG